MMIREVTNLDAGANFQVQYMGTSLHAMESSLADSTYDIFPDDLSNLKLCF